MKNSNSYPIQFLALLFSLLLSGNFLHGQFDCHYDEVANSISSNLSVGAAQISQNTNGCHDILKYIPGHQLPVNQFGDLTIRVSVIIVQNSLGVSCQFDNYQADYNQMLANINNNLTDFFANIQPSLFPNPNPTLEQTNAKIKFELDDVYYVQDDQMALINSTSGITPIYNLHGKKKATTLNLIITNSDPSEFDFGWGIGYAANSLRGSYIGMVGIGPMVRGSGTYLPPQLLGHEVGHTLGLNHSWISPTISNPQFDDMHAAIKGGSNNVMDYNWGNMNYFSPKQVANMRRVLENSFVTLNGNFDNQVGYDNQKAHTGVLKECEKHLMPYYVYEDEVWEKAMVLGRDVIVANGYKLTIKCKVSMAEGAGIIVEPGGKLLLDGALLTNSCNKYWRGIRLKGNGDRNQFQVAGTGGQYWQGYLNANNSIIENAIEGVELINDDGWRSGGIIIANNCTFRNNVRSISFQSYHNFSNSDPDGNSGNPYLNEINNASSFTRCKFVIDRELNVGNSPVGDVTMWDVKGINFRGCVWENLNPSVTTAEELGSAGIFAIDAEFHVSSDCDVIIPFNTECPPSSLERSRFSNLRAGIRALKTSGTYRFTVSETDFSDCIYGVYNEGHDRVFLLNNRFTQGNNITAPFFDIGVLSRGGSKYLIEENQFMAPTTVATNLSLGTTIENSGSMANEVYKNKFENMFVANLSLGVNRKNDPDQSQTFTGLQYLCNDMSNDLFDVAVLGNDKYDGINLYQGGYSIQGPGQDAGNLFSNNGSNSTGDLYNESYWPINYVFSAGPRSEPIYRSLSVQLIQNSSLNNCPSRWGKDIIKKKKLTLDEKQTLVQQAGVAFLELENVRSNYSNLLDAGNTGNRINEINTSTATYSTVIRNSLLSKSPYLSDDVLKAAAERSDVLSNNQLFEILAANPDGIKSEELLKILEDKNNPFPASWIEYLKDQWNVITYRTTLEALLAAKQNKLEDICELLIADAMIEENGTVDYSAIRYWSEISRSLHSDFLLFDEMITEGGFDDAANLLTEMPIRNKLNSAEMIEYLDFAKLGSVLIDIRRSGTLGVIVNSSQKNIIEEVAMNGNYAPNLRAKNWLILLGEQPKDWFVPQIPNQNQSKLASKGNVASAPRMFTLQPNPSSDLVYINGSAEVLAGARCELADATGKIVMTQIFNDMPSQTIEVNKLSAGFYTVRVIDINGKTQTEKLIVK
jgi:hypothetical protein